MSRITLNRLDSERIRNYISDAKQFKSISNKEIENLIRELESAEIPEPEVAGHFNL